MRRELANAALRACLALNDSARASNPWASASYSRCTSGSAGILALISPNGIVLEPLFSSILRKEVVKRGFYGVPRGRLRHRGVHPGLHPSPLYGLTRGYLSLRPCETTQDLRVRA